MTMHDHGAPESSPANTTSEPPARRLERFHRLMELHPNAWMMSDLFTIITLILFLIIVTPVLVFASTFAPSLFSKWVLSTSPWIVWPILGTATIVVAWVARWLRDERKSKYYALIEIPVGVALSVQGVVQQGLMLSQTASFFAALIAFVAGLRIAIDGWKRFYENDTRSLLSVQRLQQTLRAAQRP